MRQPLRRAVRVATFFAAAAGLAACASAVHTPDHVSTILARESAAKPSRLQNVGVVAIVSHFAPGTHPHDDALVANGNYHMDALMPAIMARLPLLLARDGIHAEAVPSTPGHTDANLRALARFDDVIEFAPFQASQQKNVADASLVLDVRVLNHALQPLWVARVELRTDALPAGRRDEIRNWGPAMADDLSGLLLQQLGEDGFVAAPAR